MDQLVKNLLEEDTEAVVKGFKELRELMVKPSLQAKCRSEIGVHFAAILARVSKEVAGHRLLCQYFTQWLCNFITANPENKFFVLEQPQNLVVLQALAAESDRKLSKFILIFIHNFIKGFERTDEFLFASPFSGLVRAKLQQFFEHQDNEQLEWVTYILAELLRPGAALSRSLLEFLGIDAGKLEFYFHLLQKTIDDKVYASLVQTMEPASQDVREMYCNQYKKVGIQLSVADLQAIQVHFNEQQQDDGSVQLEFKIYCLLTFLGGFNTKVQSLLQHQFVRTLGLLRTQEILKLQDETLSVLLRFSANMTHLNQQAWEYLAKNGKRKEDSSGLDQVAAELQQAGLDDAAARVERSNHQEHVRLRAAAPPHLIMNSFYQLNASTIFLQATVMIVKITNNEDILDLLPLIFTIFAALLLLKFYISHQAKFKPYLITLLLVDMLFINLFQKRNQTVAFAKYIQIGRFLLKYTDANLKSTYIHIFIAAFAFTLESLLYDHAIVEPLAILGWYLIFYCTPPMLFKRKDELENDKQIQLPLSADHSQCREKYDRVSQRGDPLEEAPPKKNNDETKSEFPLEFYKQILQRNNEGILIFNKKLECLFASESLSKILKIEAKRNAVEAILNLRNSYQEIKAQEKVNDLFVVLSDKLRTKEPQEFADGGAIENNDKLSSTETVQEEFWEVIRQAEARLANIVEKNEKRMRFLLEKVMLCQLDILNKTFDRQQTFQSNYRGPALYEVKLKPFAFERKVYLLLTIKDVTHFNQISFLQKINENKSSMLAQVAHEFRTPLNCISLMVENMMESVTEEQADEYLKPIQISAKTLLSYVNDLLDVAQLKAGKFKLIYVKFDLRELVLEIQKFLRPQLEAKGNMALVDIVPNKPLIIYSDPNRIRQILFNLVSNSNKFTNKGTITIQVHQTSEEKYELSVRDTGVGIDPQDQNQLFKAFSKLERNKDMNTQGVGLGLMISNILAEKLSIPSIYEGTCPPNEQYHGLTVKSDGKGKGACFAFQVLDQFEYISQQGKDQSKYAIKVPEVESECVQQTIKRTKTKLDRQFGEKTPDIYIMVVDDEGFNIQAVSKRLSKKFKVEGFTSAQDAIERVKRDLPLHTIILMDIEMPQMDGFEATRRIKELKGEQVYIIGCTGHGHSIKDKCLDAGMDNLLGKPIKLDALMSIIDSLF